MIETPTVTVQLQVQVPNRATYETIKGKIDAFLAANPEVKLVGRMYVERG